MSGQRARFRRKQAISRRIVVGSVLVLFFLPFYGMLDYTTKNFAGSGRSLDTWRTLLNFGKIGTEYPDLKAGFIASVLLAVITPILMLALLLPTMTWVRLRLPGLSRTVEFICLLPLTVPAIVLVVGLSPVYAWVTYIFGGNTVWLCFAYVVLVLPYAYRALDTGLRAIDVKTLSEAARSLGAGWGTVMWKIILPNLKTAVLSASFLAVALTLGEFTIANLYNRTNLQVAMFLLGKSDAQISVAVAFLSLVFAFVVLFAMSFVGSGRAGISIYSRLRRTKKETA